MADTEGELIFKSDGMPFANEKAATIQATRMLRSDNVRTKVVAVEGGFALRRLFIKSSKRIPPGKRNVLTFPPIPGYKLRVVNDKPEDMARRIKQMQDAGWEIVQSSERLGDEVAGAASPLGSAVTKPVGKGTTGVLMKKKIEWYEEDEELKMAQIDENERGLVHQAEVDGRYGKVEIKRGR